MSVRNVRRVNVMQVRILSANPSHNANSVTEFDFPWRANANANFVLLILRIREVSFHVVLHYTVKFHVGVANFGVETPYPVHDVS